MSSSRNKVVRGTLSWLPESARRALKGSVKRVRIAWLTRFRAFDVNHLLEYVRKIGVANGQVIVVHSSFDRFAGFRGKPSDVIEVLQEAVGPQGTILMPTFTFRGSAIDYAASSPVFDVRRTPSRMGLLTEVFRRLPDVTRSLHPTHSVAAWGAKAAEIIRDHPRAATPCGVGSPFAKLLEHDGKILLLGTGIRAMSFYHTIEELLEPELPFSPFTADHFTLECRDGDRSVTTTMRLMDPKWSHRRNLRKLTPVLQERGAWRSRRVGSLQLILLDAREVLEACRVMASHKKYCYDE